MNLSDYKSIDPDTIYHNSDYKITFFYLPWSDELLYDKDGFQTHEDLLTDDDTFFDKVFPNLAKETSGKKRPYRTRGQALKHTKAILGRFGMLHNEMIVALWNPLTNPHINKLIKKIYQTFPQLAQMEVILIGSDGKPKVMEAPNEDRAIKNQKIKKANKNEETYYINGFSYTYDDLKELRLSIHTGTYKVKDNARNILCHPDMNKYPELNDLRISCETPKQIDTTSSRSNWQDKLGPYAFKYGESFRNFIKNQS